MPRVRISIEAEEDIDGIAAYSTRAWGWRQADRYLAQLEGAFDLLARNPSIGRPSNAIRDKLKRFEIGRHAVFYLQEQDGVLIVRILHQQMLPDRYIE